MRILMFAAALAAAAVADARAETTAYQPSAASRAHFGYSETTIDANRVRVSFSGNAETSRETVETYLLFRAAELTLQRGFDYFVIADHNVESRSEYAAAGPPLPPIAPPRRYRELTSYSAVSDVIMHRGAKPPGGANIYDARTVHANLAWRISRPN